MARPVLRTTARGKQGPVGPQGERGPQGLPATNAAEDDAAIATFATTPGTATHSALTGTFAPATVFARDYCAEDGVTDDGPGLASAGAALVAAGGGRLVLTRGASYYLNTDTKITAPGVHVEIAADGAPILLGPDITEAIHITGTRTQLDGGDNAYAATTAGDLTLTTTSDLSGALAAGDWIMVWSADADNAERPTQYLSGEEAVVVDVDTTTITLDRPIRLTHSSGVARRLYRLDLTIEPTITGADATCDDAGGRAIPLAISYGLSPRVERPKARGKRGRYGLRLDQCIGGVVDDPSADTLYDAGNGAAPNGIAVLLNGCVSTVVNRPRARKTRHCVDINSYSSSGMPGLVSRDVVVNDIEGIGTFGPPASIHHARGTTFNHITAIQCGGGVHTRGFDTTIRDFRPIGGSTGQPPEWTGGSRAVPSGIAVGETDALPLGEGLAGVNLVIENYDPRGLPEDWRPISWSDAPGSGLRITGPTFVDAPGVVMSDSADRADGPLGEADLALGGVQSYEYWAWKQGTAGVVIASGKFARPSGDIGHGVRTPEDVPANVEVSARWDSIGTPGNMNCLFVRGSDDNTLTEGYALGVTSAGTASIVLRAAGSSTNLASSSAGAVVNGDLLTLRAVGRRIVGLVNGQVVVEVNDTSVTSAGRAGFWFRNTGGDGWQASHFLVRALL